MRPTSKSRRRGFVLVLMALMAVVLFACLGLSVDLGRMFIAKHETQIFTDSAALAAALQLDGTRAGALAATSAVDNDTNKWNLGTQGFSGSSASHQVDFGTTSSGPWVKAASVPSNATGYLYVRVQGSVTLPLYFINVVSPVYSTTINASAVAGQTPETSLWEGMFPFTPMSFPGASYPDNPYQGYAQGVQYTIRYPSSPAKNPCQGDIGVHTRDASDRGYWGDNSASVIRKRIVDDYQSGAVAIAGQLIGLTTGAKTTEASDVNARSAQDTDQTSTTWAQYQASTTKNGRRLVVMPISDYNTGIALGFASFLLLPDGSYDKTGNAAWCAVYVGPWTQDQPGGGASGSPGASQVRLVK